MHVLLLLESIDISNNEYRVIMIFHSDDIQIRYNTTAKVNLMVYYSLSPDIILDVIDILTARI